MTNKIPNKSTLEKNRKNLEKMMGDEYAERINTSMVQLVKVCRANDIEIDFFVQRYISDFKSDRIKKMLYLDALMYLHPEKIQA
jgi:hypothetical protein